LKVAAYANLGGLGTKQGPPVGFGWTMPNILPLLLPWLAVLVLLALPSNRTTRAWWIWAPLIGIALLGAGLESATEALNDPGFGYAIQAACAAAFGLAAIWLLGSAMARRCRTLAMVFMALAFAMVSLLALAASPVFEQVWDLRRWESAVVLYLLLFWVVSGLVFAGALNLTGCMCRSQFTRPRVALRLPLSLCVMWIVPTALLGCVMKFASGGGSEWGAFLMGALVLTLVSYVMILPFLLLSFASSFYGHRLKCLLRLPATVSTPPAAIPAPIADQVPARP
jgi:hypothetical protein